MCVCGFNLYTFVLVRVSVAVKVQHDHGNSYIEKHLIGVHLQFRGLVPYQQGGKHGSRHGTREGAIS